jgi:hypothetical protein
VDEPRRARDGLELSMKLATDTQDLKEGAFGLCELASSYLNDRKQGRVAKSELVVYANEEQNHLAALINRWAKHFFATSSTTSVVANQAYYSMPPKLVSLLGIEIGDTAGDEEPQPLVEIPLTDQHFYARLEAVNAKGDAGYFFIAGTQFRLMPKHAGTGTIRVHHVKRLERLSGNDDESEIPEEHHEAIALGMARRGLVKLRERNDALIDLYRERVAAIEEAVKVANRGGRTRTEPWYGSYGPTEPWDPEVGL